MIVVIALDQHSWHAGELVRRELGDGAKVGALLVLSIALIALGHGSADDVRAGGCAADIARSPALAAR